MYNEIGGPTNTPAARLERAQEAAYEEFTASGGSKHLIREAITDAIEEYQANFYDDYEDDITESLFALLRDLEDI